MIVYKPQMAGVFCASDAFEDVLLINKSVSKLRPREFSHVPYTGTEHSRHFLFQFLIEHILCFLDSLR